MSRSIWNRPKSFERFIRGFMSPYVAAVDCSESMTVTPLFTMRTRMKGKASAKAS